MKFIKSAPLALSGLSLSIAALGNLLLPYGPAVRYFCGILSAGILTIYIIKVISDFPQVKEETKTPVILSVMPTSTMALMLLCIYIIPYVGIAAVWLWLAAVMTHLFLMILFFKRFVLNFDLNNVFPSWFVAFVGIVTAAVTAPVIGAHTASQSTHITGQTPNISGQFSNNIGQVVLVTGQAAFIAGIILYAAAFVLVVYRMIKIKDFPEPARPTIAIFTAPMSLCTVGFFASFNQHNEVLIYIMLTFALALYIFVSIKMISLLRLKFYPSYSAFTFPYVISATAFRLGAGFLAEREMHFLTPVAYITQWIAVAVVSYVLIRYTIFFISIRKPIHQ